MSEKLLLVDGHSILNRAFFGLPDLTNSQGVHTNAVLGFLNILFKIMEEEKPDYLTVAFDLHEPTFRHKMFDGYKGTRKPMAEELRQQVPLIKEMLTAMGICLAELPGYEADDILGTLSVRGEKAGMEVRVLSGDRDLLQLATDHVQIRIPKTKAGGTEIENYFAADVKARYQVTPKEFIDVKALQGDASDNIPGVPGIGEKTAQALIAAYGSIEAVHENAAVVKPPRAAKNIVEFWDQAVMSKTLAKIITDAPVEHSFERAKIADVKAFYTQEAYKLCKELELKSLLSRFEVKAPASKTADSFHRITTKKEAEEFLAGAAGKDIGLALLSTEEKDRHEENDGQLSLFAREGDENEGKSSYLSGKKRLVSAVAVCLDDGDCSLLLPGEALPGDLLFEKILKSSRISCMDLKEILAFLPIEREKCFDAGLAAYLLNPLVGDYPYEDLAKNELGLLVPSRKDCLGKNKAEEVLQEAPEKLMTTLCYEAYTALMSRTKLENRLKEEAMLDLYYQVELPLVFVLSDMEKAGIVMDGEALKIYGEKLAESISQLEKQIYEEAGETFNINSPKQLGVILFEKLLLPGAKKTKTGYSTSADILEGLAGQYPIVAHILDYRQLSKLKSTYADGLAACLADDGRIHTTFNQKVTATGRLSSTDPNLQNIPIRIELGKQIRRVFLPAEGNIFIDSDYSQIELRILAHMSGDQTMIRAFREGQDIHATTAAQVFHVPFDQVTPLQRRSAKAVNFGIVYGISAHGLSEDLHITRREAQDFIDSYFKTFPGIHQFLEKAKEDAKEQGKCRTLYGRIRPIPELKSANFVQRQFGERVAMNAPIQGTAADIIKIAMIRVHDRLLSEGLNARLILQVHDELLIEAPAGEKDRVIRLLEEEMKGAAELSVELSVGTETGSNWYDAH